MINTIRLRSGKYFDLLNPKPEQFTFRDVAVVCRIWRFGGHCERQYYVGEHLWHGANIAKELGYDKPCQKAVFAHDWPEFGLSDMVKPLKMAIPQYQEIEAIHEEMIGLKYDIDFKKYHGVIKEIDMALLIAEKNTLFRPDGVKWYYEDKAVKVNFEPRCWGPKECEENFMKKAIELGINIYE